MWRFGEQAWPHGHTAEGSWLCANHTWRGLLHDGWYHKHWWELLKLWSILCRYPQNLSQSLTPISSRSTFSQPFKDKCMWGSERIGSIIILHLSKRWKTKFFILCDAILLSMLQEKFEIDHSWEWKVWCAALIHLFVCQWVFHLFYSMWKWSLWSASWFLEFQFMIPLLFVLVCRCQFWWLWPKQWKPWLQICQMVNQGEGTMYMYVYCSRRESYCIRLSLCLLTNYTLLYTFGSISQ